MTQLRTLLRQGGAAALVAGLAAAACLVFAGAASAQTTSCPAGAPGGVAGDAGRSTAGNGGLAFTVGPFATGASGGTAIAPGGDGGSARGGDGGRGGSGTLPICNQNTNNVGDPAPVAAAPAAAPARAAAPAAAYGTGDGLARTGARSYAEVGLGGLALVAGGFLLYAGQPRIRRARA
jgi:hypothetical protein